MIGQKLSAMAGFEGTFSQEPRCHHVVPLLSVSLHGIVAWSRSPTDSGQCLHVSDWSGGPTIDAMRALTTLP